MLGAVGALASAHTAFPGAGLGWSEGHNWLFTCACFEVKMVFAGVGLNYFLTQMGVGLTAPVGSAWGLGQAGGMASRTSLDLVCDFQQNWWRGGFSSAGWLAWNVGRRSNCLTDMMFSSTLAGLWGAQPGGCPPTSCLRKWRLEDGHRVAGTTHLPKSGIRCFCQSQVKDTGQVMQ